MNAVQGIIIVLIGGLVAASIYLLMAISGPELLSSHAIGHGAVVGYAGIPAIIASINIARPNKWTFLISVLVVPILLVFVFANVLANAMPGSNFVPPESVSLLAQLPIIAAVVTAIRCPGGRRLLLASFICCFLAGTLAIRFVVEERLKSLVTKTISEGGCVFALSVGERPLKAADEIELGWIVGPASGPIFFVYDNYALRWSYSRLGLDTRMGIPTKHEIPEGMSCS